MATYVCTSVDLVTNDCLEWSEQVGMLPSLSAEQGMEIGGSILLVFATAWGFRFLSRFILNR